MRQDDYREYRHYRVFWRRFLAQWIDFLLLRPVTWLHDLALPHLRVVTNQLVEPRRFTPWGQQPASDSHISLQPLTWPPVVGVGYGLLLYAPMLYSVLLRARYGQTVGKRLLGIRVLDVSDQQLRPGQAVRRDLVTDAWATWNLLSAWPFLLQGQEPVYLEGQLPTAAVIAGWGMVDWAFAELLAMLANEKRRSLHDFIAGSVVVKL